MIGSKAIAGYVRRDHQMSYLIDISKQRRKEYTDAMDNINKRGLTSQEIDFMKRKPPDSSAQSEEERKNG